MDENIQPAARRVLVSGAAGFLGSHLCDRLLADNSKATVIGLDDLSSGAMRNLQHLADHPDFAFHRHDVIEPFDARVDEIYNLACPASPVHYQRDPVRTLKTSVFGILRMLDLAGRNGARLLQTSTSEVYGDPTITPQHEAYWGNVNPFGPRACYDEGKRAAETLLYDYRRMEDSDVRIMRIFNTYGPRMQPDDGRVVSNFIVQALTGEPITLYGDGSQTRSFCYVDDMIDAMILLMRHEDRGLGPVNIGNPNEMTIGDLAELVLDLTGSKSPVFLKPLPENDPMQRCPDISKAKAVLDWQPRVPLAEGLARTIADFEQRLRHDGSAAAAE